MMLIHSAVPLYPPVWRVDGISKPIAAFPGDKNDLHEFKSDPNNGRPGITLSFHTQNQLLTLVPIATKMNLLPQN
jgi:hypothetical protein